ncbi:hypothetical protein [Enterovirga sp.]|nr:hypothetical protein [Enterovirga sp.]HMO29214.1 hypothetical protein [Enterovirga sp.]
MMSSLGLPAGANLRRILEVLAVAGSFVLIAAIVLGGLWPV